MVGFEWGKQDLSVNGKGNQQHQQHTPHNNGSSGHHQPKVGSVLSMMLHAVDLPNSITRKVEHCCLCTSSLAFESLQLSPRLGKLADKNCSLMLNLNSCMLMVSLTLHRQSLLTVISVHAH